jgi:hypothetical protein
LLSVVWASSLPSHCWSRNMLVPERSTLPSRKNRTVSKGSMGRTLSNRESKSRSLEVPSWFECVVPQQVLQTDRLEATLRIERGSSTTARP